MCKTADFMDLHLHTVKPKMIASNRDFLKNNLPSIFLSKHVFVLLHTIPVM